jgi:DNA-binding SARP family transcriptional activator/tetratricopeptide (TPR) repeat protein
LALRSSHVGHEFGLLGPLVVRERGHELALAGAKERGVLAFLLLRANEVVPAERLIDALWPDDPPATARNSLQVRISHLRKVLGQSRIDTLKSGYCLTASFEEVDLLLFRRLVADARRLRDEGDLNEAGEKLGEALVLWRGDVLPEFVGNPLFRLEIGPLEEERVAAFELWADAQLELGGGSELVPELQAAVAANPLRERLMGDLMLALYRAGRQSEALAVYADSRRRLVEELGLEPGPMLADLQQRILTQDPALAASGREPRRAVSPARRNLTVVLVPLPVSAEKDPEVVERTLATNRERVSAVFAELGVAVSVKANVVIAAFGLPASREDDAHRAIRTAGRLSQEGMRVAVDTGVALATETEILDSRLIAHLEELVGTAEAGSVVVGKGVQAALGASIETSGSRLVAFDDAAEPIPRRYDAPLIGRDREFERLREAFDWALRNRSSHLVTVLGPAGIGKSRLARELAEVVAGEAGVLSGRCLSYESGAFWPLAEMVKQAAGDTTPEALHRLLADIEDRRPIVDQLAAALGTGQGMRAEDAFWAFRRLFLALAAERPLVLVFEDLHWADERLFDFVEELVERTEGVPLLVLCLARPELVEERPGWGGAGLNAESIQLAPLSDESSHELIRVLGDRVAEDARRRIAARAEGNPLFIEQLVALTLDEPEAPSDTIPISIQSVLAARFDRLPSKERELLERASIVGLEFSLAGVAALGRNTVSRTELSPIAQRLVRKDLLRLGEPHARNSEAYRFRHILIRDVVYTSILKATRAELHERFARWLEQDQEQGSEVDSLIGYHLEAAYLFLKELAPDDKRLAGLADEAGERLTYAGADEIGSSSLTRGSELLERALGLLSEDSSGRGSALAWLSYAFRLRGRMEEAKKCVVEGFAWAEARQDEPLRAFLTLADLQLKLHRDPAFSVEDFVAGSAQALDLSRRTPQHPYIARIQGTLAWAYALLGRHQVAVDLIESVGPHEHMAELNKLLPSLWLGGAFPVADAARRCEALLAEDPAPRTRASCYRSLATLWAMRGDFATARRLCELDRQILDDLGMEAMREATTSVAAAVELLADQAEAAERMLGRSIRKLETLGAAMHATGLGAQRARALLLLGRDDEGWATLNSLNETLARDIVQRIDMRGVRALLLARRGELEASELAAREAVSMADATDSPDLRAVARVDLGRVLAASGRRSQARSVFADALRLFDLKGNVVDAGRTRRLIHR